eukprot:TRINITY_DN12179_c0_g2_i1.p1 TRINITY_DN12179_c0_g2~~TRINITY_DN12179_c0_g2_i1.p1  ORF type:complete len:908 (-),score=182.44 TRINITY_DN12179_c0_g2_i1:79-2802(-)
MLPPEGQEDFIMAGSPHQGGLTSPESRMQAAVSKEKDEPVEEVKGQEALVEAEELSQRQNDEPYFLPGQLPSTDPIEKDQRGSSETENRPDGSGDHAGNGIDAMTPESSDSKEAAEEEKAVVKMSSKLSTLSLVEKRKSAMMAARRANSNGTSGPSVPTLLSNDKMSFVEKDPEGPKSARSSKSEQSEASPSVSVDNLAENTQAVSSRQRGSVALGPINRGRASVAFSGNNKVSLYQPATGTRAKASVMQVAMQGRGVRASVMAMNMAVGNADGDSPELSKDELLEQAHKEVQHFDPNKIERDDLATANASLTFKNISFSVNVPDPDDPKAPKLKKTILDNCWGHIPAGKLVALMGPSGCGKSTLLDILAQKKTARYEGDVYINGRKPDNMYRRITGYVGQQDIMPEHWTVREAVLFNVALKKPIPAGVTWANLQVFVDTVLEDVGLLHVADTKIGGESVRGISGGQRRRVTLARGIAANPNLLFCDEPTSGLSGTDATLCMKAMVGMTRRWNTTILVVIHQPRLEVAQLFDHLILLTSRPGRIVYNGPMSAAAAYWEKAGHPVPAQKNPTDWLIDKVTPGAPKGDPEYFADWYIEEELPKLKGIVEEELKKTGPSPMDLLENERRSLGEYGRLPATRPGKTAKPWLLQFYILLDRKARLTMRSAQVLACTIGVKFCLGILLGIIFWRVADKEPEGLAQMSFVLVLTMQVSLGVFMNLPVVIQERTVMKLETSEGLYSVSAHLLAQSIVDVAIGLLANSIQVTLMYSMAGMNWTKFPLFLMYALAISQAMEAMALVFASMGKNGQTAQEMAMPPILVFMIFSGYFVNEVSSPEFLKWILKISPVCHCMQALCHQLYGDNPAAWKLLQNFFGYKEPDMTFFWSLAIGLFAVSKMAQVLVLKKMHAIQH